MSKKEEERVENPMTVTGNRPPADRSPNSTSEGKRQEAAKAAQAQALKDAPKASGKKPSADEDPLRYYQGSELQKKIEEENLKISESNDAGDKKKMVEGLRKEVYPEKKESREEKEEEKSESRSQSTVRRNL